MRTFFYERTEGKKSKRTLEYILRNDECDLFGTILSQGDRVQRSESYTGWIFCKRFFHQRLIVRPGKGRKQTCRRYLIHPTCGQGKIKGFDKRFPEQRSETLCWFERGGERRVGDVKLIFRFMETLENWLKSWIMKHQKRKVISILVDKTWDKFSSIVNSKLKLNKTYYLKRTEHIARITHWCDNCCQYINPGEMYERIVQAKNWKITEFKSHFDCEPPEDPTIDDEKDVSQSYKQAA